MIVILQAPQLGEHCTRFKSALGSRFGDCEIAVVDSSSDCSWPGEPSWSDVLVIPFDENPLSSHGQSFVQTLLQRNPRPFILPVAVSGEKCPPMPADKIKALPWEDDGFVRGCLRIGARLGLSLRSRDHRIFVSYRSTDGSTAAIQLQRFLEEQGYNVWRDDSQDPHDGQTSIAPGEEVQKQIEENLKRVDLVLLLDTPRACESEWINLEVGLANGELIPVLPILFRLPNERVLCSRFRALDTLQRSVTFEVQNGSTPVELHNPELNEIAREMEQYLCDIFQRRRRVPSLLKRDFDELAFEWSQRDRFIYEAIKRLNGKIVQRIFSHCSFYDGIYNPALCHLLQRLKGVEPPANYILYVYDGALIPPVQIRHIEFQVQLTDRSEVILLHYSEVMMVLKSHFCNRP